MAHPYFEVRENEEDGLLRLRLTGELDLGSAPALKQRLLQLSTAKRGVRLDLSALDFIDSTGIHVLVWAVAEARSDGWRLEIDRKISPGIERVLRLIHVYGLLIEGPPPEPASS
jgi:anti-sigma B factor antagonist